MDWNRFREYCQKRSLFIQRSTDKINWSNPRIINKTTALWDDEYYRVNNCNHWELMNAWINSDCTIPIDCYSKRLKKWIRVNQPSWSNDEKYALGIILPKTYYVHIYKFLDHIATHISDSPNFNRQGDGPLIKTIKVIV